MRVRAGRIAIRISHTAMFTFAYRFHGVAKFVHFQLVILIASMALAY